MDLILSHTSLYLSIYAMIYQFCHNFTRINIYIFERNNQYQVKLALWPFWERFIVFSFYKVPEIFSYPVGSLHSLGSFDCIS